MWSAMPYMCQDHPCLVLTRWFRFGYHIDRTNQPSKRWLDNASSEAACAGLLQFIQCGLALGRT